MYLKLSAPKSSLNKAYRDEPIGRNDIELFKEQLKQLFIKADTAHSEDTLKDFVTEFLRNTYYKTEHIITVNKERKDFSIHTGKATKDPVAVIAEVKKMAAAEMITEARPNVKAFHELVLYYLRERITFGNNAVKHLLATDVNNWLIIDANEFDKKIYSNTKIKKLYELYISDKKDNPFFYGELKKILEETDISFDATEFSFDKLQKIINNADKSDDNKLIPVYKILSPVHLLKLPFANDSNSLDKNFYTELLHIIGLEEIKEGGKKILRPKHTGSDASLLENTIIKLQDKECLRRVPELSRYGSATADQYHAVALELCITWVNRILFLKLLEAQLYSYHRKDNDYLFLNDTFIHDYDELSNLFFQVLAERPENRRNKMQEKFARVPYLNSSLFERTELEQHTIGISELDNSLPLPLLAATVLKNGTKRRTGSIPTLSYLLHFLNSYAFAGESKGGIQEENKTLINASVLGLIFEKINGYKDGSFFTPGFITMYMCRETLRRAVVQKFNETNGSAHQTFEDLQEHIEYSDKTKRQQANDIINSLTICDPAVGSGHFLVSALNELIAIKNDLKILQYRHSGLRIKEYSIEVLNDELRVRDAETEEPFEYLLNLKGNNKPELQQMQETLFHEKETLIENCLFGVDINANSVKICRLRLWIELLKNAYYTTASNSRELETLPNIDINIKQGNSLISRFAMDADLAPTLAKSRFTIDSYKAAVQSYRSAQSKEEKREMETLIEKIKTDFKTDVVTYDPINKKLSKLRGELALLQQNDLFSPDTKKKTKANAALEKLSKKITEAEKEKDETKNNAIYKDAFEWRFEFPEVLDGDGKYLGFDVVIGNPPYGVKFDDNNKKYINANYKASDDIYTCFIEKASLISKNTGDFSYIIPVSWQTGNNYYNTRNLLKSSFYLNKGIILPYDVFSDAYIDTGLYFFSKRNDNDIVMVHEFDTKEEIVNKNFSKLSFFPLQNKDWQNSEGLKLVFNSYVQSIQNKLLQFPIKLSDIAKTARGILFSDNDISSERISQSYKPLFVGNVSRYEINEDFKFVLYGNNLKEKPSSYEFFQGERLIIRRIISRQFRVMSVFVKEEFTCKKDYYILKLLSQAFDLKYILALLNSKFISFLKTKGSTAAKKDDFTQLTLADIREIRIPEVSMELQMSVTSLVDKIILAKKENPKADTTELENEVDELVYKLYDLTEEEIEIIKK